MRNIVGKKLKKVRQELKAEMRAALQEVRHLITGQKSGVRIFASEKLSTRKRRKRSDRRSWKGKVPSLGKFIARVANKASRRSFRLSPRRNQERDRAGNLREPAGLHYINELFGEVEVEDADVREANQANSNTKMGLNDYGTEGEDVMTGDEDAEEAKRNSKGEEDKESEDDGGEGETEGDEEDREGNEVVDGVEADPGDGVNENNNEENVNEKGADERAFNPGECVMMEEGIRDEGGQKVTENELYEEETGKTDPAVRAGAGTTDEHYTDKEPPTGEENDLRQDLVDERRAEEKVENALEGGEAVQGEAGGVKIKNRAMSKPYKRRKGQRVTFSEPAHNEDNTEEILEVTGVEKQIGEELERGDRRIEVDPERKKLFLSNLDSCQK